MTTDETRALVIRDLINELNQYLSAAADEHFLVKLSVLNGESTMQRIGKPARYRRQTSPALIVIDNISKVLPLSPE